MRELEDAAALGLAWHAGRCGIGLGGLDFGQRREQYRHRQQHQQTGHGQIRRVDLGRELVEQRGLGGRIGGLHLSVEITDAMQHQGADQYRRKDAGDLVADAHHRDAPCGGFDRAEDGDVRVDRGLQQGQAAADHEQAAKRARVPALGGELTEQRSTTGHHQQAQAQAFFHAGAAQDPRRRQGQEEVGQVEHHQHQEGADLAQLEGEFDEGDQRAVEPGEEADQEEQHADDGDGRGHVRACACSGDG